MIFPRLSPSGMSWCAEYFQDNVHTIIVNGMTAQFFGIQPAWLDEDRIIYSDTREARVWIIRAKDGITITSVRTPAKVNRLHAQNGHWLGWMPTLGAYVHDGVATYSAQEPVLTPNGELWWPPVTCIEGRATQGGFTAIDHSVKPPRIFPQEWAPWAPVTHWAIPVWTPSQMWVVRLEDERLVAHPMGSYLGIVIAYGDTRWPDAAWHHNSQTIRVIWSNAEGHFTEEWVYPNGHFVDLRPVPPPPVDPPPVDPPIPPPVEPPMPVTFSWDDVQIIHGPKDIRDWDIGGLVREACAQDGNVSCDIGGRGWKIEPFGNIEIDGNIWIFYALGNRWVGGPFDWLRPEQVRKDPERVSDIPIHDFQQAPLDVPIHSTHVALMISAPCRKGRHPEIAQRSNVVIVKTGTCDIVWREGEGPKPPIDPPTPPIDPPKPPTNPVEARVQVLEAQMQRMLDYHTQCADVWKKLWTR